ncbi:MAG TPA: carboxypeptidase-like regulatory domain-containing protein [Bacteroidia bacterium]|nr:carboxypeptidase-like regulatory domain-containing protein [Bacteroidia bacterium]HNU32055.1 carboxypeptidase-like regulatory domain-containing protein [Bacteroidia bacterium]
MLRIVLCFAFALLQWQNIYAQHYIKEKKILKGVLKAEQTNKAIAYANVYVKNTQQNALADESGFFILPCIVSEMDSVCVNALGYSFKSILVKDFKNDTVLTLKAKTELPLLQVRGFTAREVIEKAIRNLHYYFPDSNIQLESFYRQYHKENGKYVRLIEAKIITPEKTYNNFNSSNHNEKVYVKNVRRSNVYEQNKEKHGDHLIDLLYDNPVKHPVGTVLNLKGLSFYNFRFTDESNEKITVIEFNSFGTGTPKAEGGKLYIDEKTFLIEKVIVESFPNPKAKQVYYSKANHPYDWKFRNGYLEISFNKKDGYMQVAEIKKYYTHYLFDNATNSLSFLVEENFELIKTKTFSENIPEKFFTGSSNLYSQKYNYNEADWAGIKELSKEKKKDLEKTEALNVQFKSNE